MAEIFVGRGKSQLSFDPSHWDSKSDEELKQIIRALTIDARDRMKEYKDNGVDLKPVNESIKELQALGSVSVKGKLFTGKLTKKNHAGLVYQARALYNFHKWDFVTTQGTEQIARRETERADKIRLHFEKLNKLSDEDITAITEVLGALSDATKEAYGSDQLVGNSKIVEASRKLNLAEMIEDIYKHTNAVKKDLLDKLMIRIDEELKKINEQEKQQQENQQ